MKLTIASTIDPVCGMTVSPETAAGSAQHEGQTYYFCGRSCLTKFQQDPGRYISREGGRAALVELCCDHRPAAGAAVHAADESAIYICPMHLEVRQHGPGVVPEMWDGA